MYVCVLLLLHKEWMAYAMLSLSLDVVHEWDRVDSTATWCNMLDRGRPWINTAWWCCSVTLDLVMGSIEISASFVLRECGLPACLANCHRPAPLAAAGAETVASSDMQLSNCLVCCWCCTYTRANGRLTMKSIIKQQHIWQRRPITLLLRHIY